MNERLKQLTKLRQKNLSMTSNRLLEKEKEEDGIYALEMTVAVILDSVDEAGT